MGSSRPRCLLASTVNDSALIETRLLRHLVQFHRRRRAFRIFTYLRVSALFLIFLALAERTAATHTSIRFRIFICPKSWPRTTSPSVNSTGVQRSLLRPQYLTGPVKGR